MADGKKISLFAVAKSFFKVGCIGFGGGSALIPIIEREIVEKKQYMNEAAYLQHTVVANITPGALPVKLAATCASQLSGCIGSVIGMYMVMFPGVFFMLTIMTLFSVMGPEAMVYFNYASIGITAFIVFLLLSYIKQTVAKGNGYQNIVLCLSAFFLTGGKEVRAIAALLMGLEDAAPAILDISTINLMIITFFMILIISGHCGKAVTRAGICISLVYAVFSGNWAALNGYDNCIGLPVLGMATLLIFCFFKKRHKRGTVKIRIPQSAWRGIGAHFILPLIFTVAAVLVIGLQSLQFLGQVMLSTITSFGGGEAYVSVADGIFVQNGLIAPDMFYTRLVPVANALPGPILIKIASGVGYVYGSGYSFLGGWVLAAAAAAIAAGICSVVALLVLSIYNNISQSVFISALRLYILPVICGMLLSTSCSMIVESMHVFSESGFSPAASLSTMVVWAAALFTITRKRHVSDLLLLIGSAAISMVGLTVLA